MSDLTIKVKKLQHDLEIVKSYFHENLKHMDSSVHIYTHLDADGLCSGAILGRALYRANISFQITVLKQLERERVIEVEEKERNLAKLPEVYDKRIRNVLSGANKIPIQEFLNYLNIDFTFFYDMLTEWKDKYNFTYEDGTILKIN